ncbi:hypothetical protein [Sphingomonas sanxanigenens]|uniref:Uncharacterized protein n=1 Tax=Sphingomonas sanxanigenens DSM 19645 = NX02 TaxID=1123269 RepID=W0ALE1_9SPHN|nr:hypothetical protein [Sphingomonas sanxanigenens]AHE57407.1 hypothetical protein NX02_29195 [Sphingomonas sanxanigenens DSM 19645 = NX02]
MPVIEAPRELSDDLRIFDAVPHGYEVITVQERDECPLLAPGEVAVFDTSESCCGEIVNGALYVIEWQRPRAGMSWETYRRLECQYLDVRRRIYRVERSRSDPSRWWIRPLSPRVRGVIQCGDGPFHDWHLTDKIIGRVVGLYRPTHALEVRQ